MKLSQSHRYLHFSRRSLDSSWRRNLRHWWNTRLVPLPTKETDVITLCTKDLPSIDVNRESMIFWWSIERKLSSSEDFALTDDLLHEVTPCLWRVCSMYEVVCLVALFWQTVVIWSCSSRILISRAAVDGRLWSADWVRTRNTSTALSTSPHNIVLTARDEFQGRLTRQLQLASETETELHDQNSVMKSGGCRSSSLDKIPISLSW